MVEVVSSHFSTEAGYDYVAIDGVLYSGYNSVQTVISGKFTVSFLSDGSVTGIGFNLLWECWSGNSSVTDYAPGSMSNMTGASGTIIHLGRRSTFNLYISF